MEKTGGDERERERESRVRRERVEAVVAGGLDRLADTSQCSRAGQDRKVLLALSLTSLTTSLTTSQHK